jgi:CubicO group peptidase (beta-lactamase class C family)
MSNNMQGYALAQTLIERYSQQSFSNFLTDRILKPLNMTSTTFKRTHAKETGHASQAFDHQYRRIPRSFYEADMPLVAGMGGLLSTAPDILRWARLLLGGRANKNEVIPRAVLEECMSAQVLVPHSTPGDVRVTYGFGWLQDEIFGISVSFIVIFSIRF